MARKRHTPHAKGKKVARSHSTIIKEAQSILGILQKNLHVKRIVLGYIDGDQKNRQQKRNSNITRINGGIKIIVYGKTSSQEISVYIDTPTNYEEVIALLSGM